jgi:3-hydroxyacyl-CoA dehydrogenase/enoyl-CoA hydratase/3-hydroxybutyryl-CoA epimerase
VNEDLVAVLATEANPLDAESIQWRLVLPMVNEAAKALEEGVTDSVDAIDLAMVLGTGFAPFRGGVMQFANGVGAAEIVRRLEEHVAKGGSRFAPSNLIREAASANREIGSTIVVESKTVSQQHPVHT